MSAAHGQASFMGYVVLSTSLPELHLKKPGKVVSKIISNKDVYVVDMYLKVALALGRTNPKEKEDKDDSL